MKVTLEKFFGKEPLESSDLAHIVNSSHFARVIRLLDDDMVSSKIVHGGQRDEKCLRIAPTILLDVPEDSLIMNEEIFGPLLPIITVDKIQDSFDVINSKTRPLAAYLFSKDKKLEKLFAENVYAGGMCVNDTILHVFGALAISKMLSVPIVMSYHTHVPIYIPRYTFSWLVKPMWMVIKFLHGAADITLVPSAAIIRDLQAEDVTSANRIRVWNKGVDSDSFHPHFRNHEMRMRLSNGEPEKPLLVHVGRLGVEKSLDFLKKVMDRLPGVRIAFIGDGPYRSDLEKMFSGMPVVFTGMLQGEELSQAYASSDAFVMPSESETLGQVVMEAMSSGIPVVAARAGGIPEIIPEEQDGKTSFLFTPGDLDDCVHKIEQLLSDQEFREVMGKAAREEMEKHDWRAATRIIRNEHYSDAILYWRKKRAQELSPLQWLAERMFSSQRSITYRNV